MDFKKAGPNKRVCAFFIDLLIGIIIQKLFSLFLTINVDSIILSIFIIFKDCLNSQSPGKYLVGLQIVDKNGSKAKPAQTIIRNLFMIIPLFPLIEYARMLSDKEEGKRIGDNVAKTKVSDLKPQIQDNIFLLISFIPIVIMIVFWSISHYDILKGKLANRITIGFCDVRLILDERIFRL